MKVLFCTDGSKISFSAIRNFSKWMRDITVDIFCAVDWTFLPDSVSVEDSEFANQCSNSANTILDYSQRMLEEYGIRVGQKIKICGSTVDSILEICDKDMYDCIVLGSHGKKGIEKWLGSVSQEIAAVAKIPVYISKDKQDNSKVLFTVDSSDISEDIVAKSFDMFDFSDKQVYLATVYEIPDYLFLEGNLDSNWMLEVGKKQEIAAMLLLNKFEKMFEDKGIKVFHKEILNGVPAKELIDYISKEEIDLTVCGIRDRKYFARFLLNSVSKRILEHAKSDVLIIR